MKKIVWLIVLLLCCATSLVLAKDETVASEERIQPEGEGLACEPEKFSDSIHRPTSLAFPLDSIPSGEKKKKLEEPTYNPGIGFLTILVGLIALVSGAFSPAGILIAGGIFCVIGILLAAFYKQIKDKNPFKMRGNNVMAKLIVALFFFLFLVVLIGAIIIAFVVALALLLAALLSTVVSPVTVALCIIGLGVLWSLGSLVRYLIKLRRYKKSLKNG